MNYTKQELEEAILDISKFYGSNKNYKALMDSVISLPRLTDILIIDMFLNKFDYRSCEMGLYHNYNIVLEYKKELIKLGFVEFKK